MTSLDPSDPYSYAIAFSTGIMGAVFVLAFLGVAMGFIHLFFWLEYRRKIKEIDSIFGVRND